MTIEEIERILHTVAENQAQFSAGIVTLKEHTVRLEGQTAKLAESQFASQSRQEHLEEAFKQVAQSHQMLVELARIQEERIDGHDGAQRHTDSRLDALIDSQIQLTQRVEQMTERLDRLGGHLAANDGRQDGIDQRLDRLTEHLDQVAALQAENAGQIRALVEAQARTEERINQMIDQNGRRK